MRYFVLATVLMAAPAMAAVQVTYEDPGIQNTTTVFDYSGVETFKSVSVGNHANYVTDFGTSAAPVVITGTYSDVTIRKADQFGGAEGKGRYAVAWNNAPYQLDISASNGGDINYFGYWLSALDSGNLLDFYKNGSLVYSFKPVNVMSSIGNVSEYFGNPTSKFLGNNGHEPYAFVNLYFSDGASFDRIVFHQAPGSAGYESDNHTVGYWVSQGGNPVPEATTWAMLIAGFGLVGAAMRRRRAQTVIQ